MALNIIDPIGQSFERTSRLLFSGGSIGQWFALGFSAWLAQIGSGGGFNWISLPFQGAGEVDIEGVEPWLRDNWEMLTAVGLVAITLTLLLYVLLLWLRCRFQFIFLDNVIRNRTDISENWANFKPHGNALFGFSIVVSLVFLVLVVLAGGAGVGLAWPDIARRGFGPAALAGIFVGGGLLIVVSIAYAVFNRVVIDFVVPIMYRRGLGPIRALKVFQQDVLRGRVGPMLLYLVMVWLLSMVAGMLATMLICLTCGCGAIPYLSSVLLLPISVFFRTYPLYVLGQLGPDFVMLESRTTPPPPPPSGA